MIDRERKSLAAIFDAAVAAADPCRAVLDAVRIEKGCLKIAGASCDLGEFSRILVVGAGKAASRMALAVEQLLGSRIFSGLVIVKEGHLERLRWIEQIEASHPVPNESGMEGTRRILEMIRKSDEHTLVLCLLSGGASALFVLPEEGLTLQDKREATTLLLQSGASIDEMNAVRKHLSAVKGGKLAKASFPARIISLIVSDVIGDRLDVIASGPTCGDKSTYGEAWEVLLRHGLEEKMPLSVLGHLRMGMAGKIPESIKEGDPCLERVENRIVASSRIALEAARNKAEDLGFETWIQDAALSGEARETAKRLARAAISESAEMQTGRKHCLLFGGETTVTVHGRGKGGRNQELALAFAIEIEGLEGISLLCAGTDGGDGPTDAAGAMVDGKTAILAREFGLDPGKYLEDNDSYGFFEKFDRLSGSCSHFKTGPTGTNVMDIQILLLGKEKGQCAP